MFSVCHHNLMNLAQKIVFKVCFINPKKKKIQILIISFFFGTGCYPANEQLPDKDLGKTKPRPLHKDSTTHRVYGVPTIRSDLRKPVALSITNHKNHGDEPSTRDVILAPKNTSKFGLDETDFLKPRNKENLRTMILDSGCLESMAEFDEIFGLAKENFEEDIERLNTRFFVPKEERDDVMSVVVFMKAMDLNDILKIKK